MPKDVILRPNLRVDIPDFDAKTSDFSRESSKLLWERFILDNRSVIAEGFRVEIADQGTSPGLFTILNGNAVNRDGQPVNNEDDFTAARSETLSADATYFVEIEFTEADSDSDVRAFWDQTFNNGADPSGDARPSGREFSRQVATRRTPDWNIVTPISTSGFEFTTNPNSLKIPIAVITRTGGVIVGGSTSAARSVLSKTAPIASPSLTLFNTREMPDAFDMRVTVGGTFEDVTITANDRENGVLTLSGVTTLIHNAGDVCEVIDATPPQYLVERLDPDLPTSGTEDARPRLFQADEVRGAAIASDPATPGNISDVQITSLKRYIDFVAGQVSQLKWGSALTPGNVPPPSTYAAAPRYYDNSGSLAGARTNTVSIGDGVNSFGDFNTLQSGSANAAFAGAMAAVGSSGVVYVKAGTYTLSSLVTVPSGASITFVGDGRGGTNGTIIRMATGGPGLFSCNNPMNVHWENLSMEKQTPTDTAKAIVLGAGTFSARNCDISGMSASAALVKGHFENCDIVDPAGDGVAGAFADTVFQSCKISGGGTGDFAAADLDVAGVARVAFYDCFLTRENALSTSAVVKVGAFNGLTLQRCRFDDLGGSTVGILQSATGAADNLVIRDCYGSLELGLLTAGEDISNVVIENSAVDTDGTGSFVALAATQTYENWHIVKCNFAQLTPVQLVLCGGDNTLEQWFIKDCWAVSTSGDVVNLLNGNNNDANHLTVDGCTFTATGAQGCMSGSSGSDLNVVNTKFLFDDEGFGLVADDGSWNRVSIQNCTFTQTSWDVANDPVALGIFPGGGSVFNISNNTFIDCDYSIDFLGNGTRIIIANNSIYADSSAGGRTAIRFSDNTYSYVKVVGNEIWDMDSPAVEDKYGIQFGFGGFATLDNISIKDNRMVALGVGGAGTPTCVGIYLNVASTGGTDGIDITGNHIQGVSAGTNAGGIVLDSTVDDAFYERCTVSNNTIQFVGQIATENWVGISVRAPKDCNISGNIMTNLGGDDAFTPVTMPFANCGILVGSNSGTEVYEALVRENIISFEDNLSDPPAFAGIRGFGLQKSDISGNKIKVQFIPGGDGIRLTTNTTAHPMRFVNVNDNVIVGPLDYGVRVEYLNETTEGDYGLNVCNNVIDGFEIYGIWVEASDAPPAINAQGSGVGNQTTINVSGNTLYSGASGTVEGIWCHWLQGLSVNSNNIRIKTSGTTTGIGVTDCDRGVVGCNNIVTNGASVRGIDATNAALMLVTGNQVELYVDAGAGAAGQLVSDNAIRIDDFCWAASNFVYLNRTAANFDFGDGFRLLRDVNGASINGRFEALTSGDGTLDPPTSPLSLADIGINWHGEFTIVT